MPASSSSRRNRRALLVSAAALALLSIGAGAARADKFPAAANGEVGNANAYPRIDLITMGIGSLMWERHGHIALCVSYADPRRDRCYNYGVANFADPVGMGTAFFRGKKSFWVDASSPESMLSIYTRADRTVWRQRLPLSPSQKKMVIDKLRFDVKKENRYYAYDHFFDNCTTRVRDILDDAMGGALSAIDKPTGDLTIRDYARKGFYGMRWALIITDVLMGRVTDKVPTFWERMYLPEYLRLAFDTEFGVEPFVLYERIGPPPSEDSRSGRFLLFLVILLLTAPAWSTRLWGLLQRTGMAIAVVPPALLGVIIWIAVIGSPVSYLRWTEMFLIFVPFDFLLLSRRPFVVRYAQVRVVMLLASSILLAVGLFRQPLLVLLLWPLVPCAAVALIPSREWSARARAKADDDDDDDDD